MDRKKFLTGLFAEEDKPKQKPDVADQFANQKLPTDLDLSKAGLIQYSGAWGRTQTAHLLRRCLFGFTQTEMDAFSAMSMSSAVDEILNVSSTPPSPPLNHYSVGSYVDPTGIALGDTWVNAGYGDGTVNTKRRQSLKAWWMGLQINQSSDIREKMNLFWHNHFATETAIMNDARVMYKHHSMIRSYALGNFKSLVKAVTTDPGMLIYLNGYANTKGAPDENYARELMELFTLGKGTDSKYTEDDVKEAAKVLTGWRINLTTVSSFFDSSKHETANKTFSSFFGSTVITGLAGSAGANETDSLIDMIFARQDVVARHICRKLYKFFVYYVITPDIETNVIIPLADTLKSNNWEIKPVLADLFKSQHFYDSANFGCQIKSPSDFLVTLHRQSKIAHPSTGVEDQYLAWSMVANTSSSMGQDLGDPPNVAGWPAYYQEPQYYELWINSDTLPKRNSHTDQYYTTNGLRYTTGKYLSIDSIAFAEQLSNPSDPNQLVDDSIFLLLSMNLSVGMKTYLKDMLLGGQSQDHYWTDAWNAYKLDPTDVMKKATVKTRLHTMLKYMMELAEYQLA